MVLALFLVFCTVALIGYSIVPIVYTKTAALNQKRVKTISRKLDRVMPKTKIQRVTQFYFLAPVVLGGGLYFVLPVHLKLFGVVVGVIIGLIFPSIYTKMLIKDNMKKFENQLVDALMIMSSSFRGGLSLIQAMEAVTEEMPDPISQEFLTVLGENKMGVSLDEALSHLYNRVPSSALQQMITAILLARETGGNLPAIFQRIVTVIREQKRIQGQIETLTVQGKIQGVVMSLLPVAFFTVIYSTNPRFFDSMFNSNVGRMLMMYALFSEIVGGFMIWKISTFKDF